LSRFTFSFDLHDFRDASILKRNPVAHVRGEERLADGRNPTDGVRFEIEFVNTDDRIGFGRAFFSFTVTVAPKATLFDAGSGESTTWTDARICSNSATRLLSVFAARSFSSSSRKCFAPRAVM
jgi:hypothetical protein